MHTTVVAAGQHRIEANIFGDGSPAVVIEPSFGGSAAEWRSIAETLGEQTRVVTYDRAPYGASSPATDRRTPADIAADLHAVLPALGVRGPLILTGFSVGGMYMRTYAARYPDEVAGMVLIESSHEGQAPLLNEVLTWKVKLRELLFPPRVISPARTADPTAAGNGSCGMASTPSRHGFPPTAVMSSPAAPTTPCTRAIRSW